MECLTVTRPRTILPTGMTIAPFSDASLITVASNVVPLRVEKLVRGERRRTFKVPSAAEATIAAAKRTPATNFIQCHAEYIGPAKDFIGADGGNRELI